MGWNPSRAVQVFKPYKGNDYILGAVGVLQFDVTMARLKAEYGVDADYVPVNYSVARWVTSQNNEKLSEFEKSNILNMAYDAEGHMCFLTTSEWQLGFAVEQNPDVSFHKTREFNVSLS